MTRSHRLWVTLSLVATLAVAGAPHDVTRVQSGAPVTAQGTDHGVQVIFQAPPGPYFLGELLPITATIANHAGASVTVLGPPASAWTGTWVVASGGSAPSYPLPYLLIRCPPPHGKQFAPGTSMSGSFVVPLTMSGDVALTLENGLLHDGSGQPFFASGAPSVPLRVRPVAPPHRVLRLVPDGTSLSVRVADGPVPPLLVTQQIVQANHARFSLGPSWRAIKGTTIGAPPSLIAGKHETWTVLVGAAGYRITIGSYSHVPLGPNGTTPLPTPAGTPTLTPLPTPAGTPTLTLLPTPTATPAATPTISPTATS